MGLGPNTVATAPLGGQTGDEPRLARCIYAHRLGSAWQDDVLVYRGSAQDYPSITLSPSGEWLVLRVQRVWQSNAVFVRRRGSTEWQPIATDSGLIFDTVAADECLYVRTNRGAPRYAIHTVAWPEPHGSASWREVVPEGPETLNAFAEPRGLA